MRTGAETFAQLRELVQETRRRSMLASEAEAFVYLFLERILGLNKAAIKGAITHGPLDGGIDAVHIDHERARVAGCDYMGAHIVACDYVESVSEAKLPIPRTRLDPLINTWVAISSSTESGLTLNSALRQRIVELHRYWESVESTEVRHDIYFVTNRERLGINHIELERQMDYYSGHSYHYYEQADLLGAFLSSVVNEPDSVGLQSQERTDEEGEDWEEEAEEGEGQEAEEEEEEDWM